MLLFGNIKFAFKRLSEGDGHFLRECLNFLASPKGGHGYEDRHDPVHVVERIPADKAYLLGYVIERELRAALERSPDDPELVARSVEREQVVAAGKRNHRAYLVSDHLDVYVATSMRERHEFQQVAELTSEIFESPKLAAFRVRWFDPTQAYCPSRIDIGLAEALMLKRAKCTIYLAQESDTLGKDSELACTLAQGKPVIALVPDVTVESVRRLVDRVHESSRGRPRGESILSQLRVVSPELAWQDSTVRAWVADPASMDTAAAENLLLERMKRHYDQRARTLRDTHPLGIQVDLRTGVANGVLVVRSASECAELVRRVLLKEMVFALENGGDGDANSLVLREKLSGCIFRVVTGDTFLTNAFWNYYLKS